MAAAAAALAATGLVLVAVTYNGAVANRPDDSDESTLAVDQPAQQPSGTPTPYVATEEELEVMDMYGAFLDECMADAGFAEYVNVNVYDADYVPTEPWDADLSPERAEEAFLAEYGDTGAGSDYRWQDAGCAGYATHMIGADNAN